MISINTGDNNNLDNPVWFSLSESHKNFSVDYGNIKFYHPDYSPFGGFQYIENIADSIDKYSVLADDFFIVGEKPDLPDHLYIHKELVCLQMIISSRVKMKSNESIIKLTTEHSHLLYQLVNEVQPGYFKNKTALLGDYAGIFNDGKLIAVTGERMKMNRFAEVSAVITHPDHTGKGYAKQLIAHTVNNIFDQDKTPYLHVAESNAGAIKLYEKLGFKTRRKISFWQILKK